jgi:anti-anti-sigma factor
VRSFQRHVREGVARGCDEPESFLPELRRCSGDVRGALKDEEPATAAGQKIGVALVAEDSGLLRQVIKEILTEQKMADEVLTARDGNDLMNLFTQRVREKKPIDLVVLDVQMQVVNGVEVARKIRALEESMGRSRRVPFLFFSQVKCDDKFKKFLEDVKPATYLFKGDTTAPMSIAKRMNAALGQIFAGLPKITEKKEDLSIEVRKGEDALMFLKGNLTSLSEAHVNSAVDHAIKGANTLTMDFSKVEYINSSGIAILIGMIKKAKAQNLKLYYRGVTTHYQKIFKMVGLLQHVTLITEPAG